MPTDLQIALAAAGQRPNDYTVDDGVRDAGAWGQFTAGVHGGLGTDLLGYGNVDAPEGIGEFAARTGGHLVGFMPWLLWPGAALGKAVAKTAMFQLVKRDLTKRVIANAFVGLGAEGSRQLTQRMFGVPFRPRELAAQTAAFGAFGLVKPGGTLGGRALAHGAVGGLTAPVHGVIAGQDWSLEDVANGAAVGVIMGVGVNEVFSRSRQAIQRMRGGPELERPPMPPATDPEGQLLWITEAMEAEAKIQTKTSLRSKFMRGWVDVNNALTDKVLPKPGGADVIARFTGTFNSEPSAIAQIEPVLKSLNRLSSADMLKVNAVVAGKGTLSAHARRAQTASTFVEAARGKIATTTEEILGLQPRTELWWKKVNRVKELRGLIRNEIRDAREFMSPEIDGLKLAEINPAGADRLLQDKNVRHGFVQLKRFKHRQLRRAYKEGYFSKELFEDLKQFPDYADRLFLQHDMGHKATVGGKTITVTDSGLKKLDRGDINAIVTDSKRLVVERAARNEASLARNRAVRQLARAVGSDEAAWADSVMLPKKGRPGPNRWTTINYFDDAPALKGVRQELHISPEMAELYVKAPPALQQDAGALIGLLTGTNLLKAGATGYNPAFGITNFFRDIAHIWFVSDQYSKYLPVALGQGARDLAATARDAWRGGPKTRAFLNENGGVDWLSRQGQFKNAIPGLQPLGRALSKVGKFSEMWTRLALRDRAISNGAESWKASALARDYLNFNQGGYYAKFLDKFMPYFNANIQATRGLFRAYQRSPGEFIGKGAQIMAASWAWYAYNQATNPEGYDDVPDTTKERFWVGMIPGHTIDSHGNPRYRYVRFPKDEGQAVFSAAADAVAEWAHKGRLPGEGFFNTLKALNPLNLDKMPPLMKALHGYQSNWDNWYRRKIWSGPKVEPRREWNQYTEPAAVAFGETLNVRGARLEFVARNVAASGPVQYGVVGLMNQMSSPAKQMVQEQVGREMEGWMRATGLNRFFKTTRPGSSRIFELREYLDVQRNTVRLDMRDKIKQGDTRAARNMAAQWNQRMFQTVQESGQPVGRRFYGDFDITERQIQNDIRSAFTPRAPAALRAARLAK